MTTVQKVQYLIPSRFLCSANILYPWPLGNLEASFSMSILLHVHSITVSNWKNVCDILGQEASPIESCKFSIKFSKISSRSPIYVLIRIKQHTRCCPTQLTSCWNLPKDHQDSINLACWSARIIICVLQNHQHQVDSVEQR